MRIFATSRPTASVNPAALMEDMEDEVAKGRQFYREGLIVEAYMSPDYTQTFMILEAPDVDTARKRFDEYPQVRRGLIVFTFTPLIGMPAVAQVHAEDGKPMPAWWPPAN